MLTSEFAQWESYRRERAERQAQLRKSIYQRTQQTGQPGQAEQMQQAGRPQKGEAGSEQEMKPSTEAARQDPAATLELRTNTSYSRPHRSKIIVDPRFMQRMWNDPELKKEYEDYFEELDRMAERRKQQYRRAGYEVVSSGYIVDKDGGISCWTITRTIKKKKGFLATLSERNKKLREKAKKKRKEELQKEAKKALAALQKRFPSMSIAGGEKLDWKAKNKKNHVTVHSDVLAELAMKEELYKKYIGKLSSIEAMFKMSDSMAIAQGGRLERFTSHLDAEGDMFSGSVTTLFEKRDELFRRRAVKNAKENIEEQKKEKKRQLKELDQISNNERKKQQKT